jgi:pre-rRNA-processing protein RIX1
MSLPPELRVVCLQLSSTPVSDLPRIIPALLRHVLRCHVPLSTPTGNAGKADAPASSVLVHKLKTQLTTLLNGKSSDGRLAAVVLIKAVVEVGGWEVLRGSEAWVRGLLSVLGVRNVNPFFQSITDHSQKPDPSITKELCIITLTKIYCMTLQYQTLVREITTPTLPTFVTSCLNLISAKSSTKPSDIPLPLAETVFRSFAMLASRHTTIYRPFVTQIRSAARAYLAPTLSDGLFVSPSLKESARRLVVALHRTVAKNAGGEEWGKAVRELVKDVHVTADYVFRAVVEDWESTAGYVCEPIDVNQELSGGGRTNEDLPQWTGVHAGIERLTGLLEMLAEYLREETSLPVSIPLGVIMDMVNRVLSVAMPLESSNGKAGPRLHPAIDRNERDGLWTGMPQIYIAALQLIDAIAERLQESYLSLAKENFDQIAWVFPFGRHTAEFRLTAYNVLCKILLQIGPSFDKTLAGKLAAIIRSCCKDLQPVDPSFNSVAVESNGIKSQGSSSSHNVDALLRSTVGAPIGLSLSDSELAVAASELLPLFLSHIPQQYLDISLRSLIERTALLSKNKEAMLASVLNPFVGKNGKALASIVPHLTREFGHDDVAEILLRPRMPLLPSTTSRLPMNEVADADSADEDLRFHSDVPAVCQYAAVPEAPSGTVSEHPGIGLPTATGASVDTQEDQLMFGTRPTFLSTSPMEQMSTAPTQALSQAPAPLPLQEDVRMATEDEDSDDESVHLIMQLDTDSESD